MERYQAGFRANKSTSDRIFQLRQIIDCIHTEILDNYGRISYSNQVDPNDTGLLHQYCVPCEDRRVLLGPIPCLIWSKTGYGVAIGRFIKPSGFSLEVLRKWD